jgi:protein involved in polysaccharide export with SLBB domain
MRFFGFVVCAILSLSPLAAFGQKVESLPPVGGQSLAPGDVIRIAIWREPDLSGEFLVDEQGIVTLPLLGKRSVLNLPVAALRDSLVAGYSVELRNPSVTITPLRRIYVLGEVTKPGLYTVDPTISLSGAVALAGGATSLGDINRLRVVRGGAVVLNRVAVGSSLSSVDIRSEDQIFVDRRGWLERNSTFVVSASISAAALIISVLLR